MRPVCKVEDCSILSYESGLCESHLEEAIERGVESNYFGESFQQRQERIGERDKMC